MQEIDITKYKPFAGVVGLLKAVRDNILIRAAEVEESFAPPDERCWTHPFGYAKDLSLGDVLGRARSDFTKFIVRDINRKLPNLEIDIKEVEEYVKTREVFDVAEIVAFIQKSYADEDGIVVKQLRDTCSHLLPWGSFGTNGHHEKATKPEHLGMKGNDRGMELSVYEGDIGQYGRHYGKRAKVAEFIKLVDVALGRSLPSEAQGAQVEPGAVYRDVSIKSLRYYQNNNLRVIFHTKEDCDKVKAAFFSEEVCQNKQI
nr:MAG: hypothetical protein OI719_00330 [Candidatus Methanoperedens sp.]